MKKVLVTEEMHPSLMDGLENLGYEIDYLPGILIEEVESIIHSYYGIVVATRINIDRELIEKAIELRFIARAGSGMENIDVAFAQSKNIQCINSPEGNANSVGEHCVGLLLAMFHNITRSFLEIKNGHWLVNENRVHELEGRTIALIGYGNTGKSFAEKLKPFGMNVLAYDKYLRNFGNEFAIESDMENIFREAEIISFHIPLNNETKFLVNLNYLQRFHKKLHLINTSRGKIINHADLLESINDGKVINAALDVYENENFSAQSNEEKNVFNQLLNTNKIIFTPHVAGKSFESRKKIAEVLLRKIRKI